MNRTVKTALSFCGVAVLLAAVMLTLNAALAARDAAALRTAHAMPPQTELLSPEAQSIPLASAFWQRAHFYTDYDFFPGETAGNTATISPKVLLEQCRALNAANVLPQQLLNSVQSVIAAVQQPAGGVSAQNATQYPGKLGFTRQHCDNLQTQQWGDVVTELLLYDQNGTPTDMPYDDMLQAYLVYLGIDTLTDWQPMPFSAENDKWLGAAAYSESAQLYVQVLVDTSAVEGYSFSCSVSHLAPQVAAQSTKAVKKA